MAFKDHFSRQSSDYSRYRPHYPGDLFDYLLQQCTGNAVALDCATGSGQAAGQLAQRFDRVIASDASLAQLQQAHEGKEINYLCSEAESLPIKSNSLDLITAAQAAHWFERERFYTEVHRILKPGGVLAIWCYGLFKASPEIDTIINDYYNNTVGQYWPPERKLLEEAYSTLDFPYAKISTPQFHIEADRSLDDIIGYLQTWSATQHYIEANKSNPLSELKSRLQVHWSGNSSKHIQWPIHLLVGKKP